MARKKTTPTTTPPNQIWIELERPRDAAHGEIISALANNLLARMGITHAKFWWSTHEARYCYGDKMGYTVLNDEGVWLNLDHLGRPLDQA